MTTSAKEVIAAALFEWGGSGQGVDDILAEIATAQTVAILAALDAAGYAVVPREPTPAMVAALEACLEVIPSGTDMMGVTEAEYDAIRGQADADLSRARRK